MGVPSISRTFFVTALGRSGTMFLATLLNRSASYLVKHEWHLPIPGFQDRWLHSGPLQRFPIHRFWLARYPFPNMRRGYGEVNSHLRFTLNARSLGVERYVEKRGIIFRDPRDVIASIMNRLNHTAADFPDVARRVLTAYFRLLALSEAEQFGYQSFQFDRMTTDLDYLKQIIAWTGIQDVEVGPADLATKVNINKVDWFPRWPDWEDCHVSVYDDLENELRAAAGP